MRRSALDRVLKKVKQVTPKWFYKRCNQCNEDIKHETIWKLRYTSSGLHTITYSVYTCKKCAPTIIDFIEQNEKYFESVDLEPLRKKYESMRKHNADGHKPPFVFVSDYMAYDDKENRPSI